MLRYGAPFDQAALAEAPALPLEDEPHLADWRAYAAEAGPAPFAFLQARLPQLRIPVREGAAAAEAYAAVVRRGAPFRAEDFGGELALRRPQAFRFYIHEHPAGALPVLATAERGDFETLWHALGCRSEPRPVAPSVNAQMIAGLVNWDRVQSHRRRWLAEGGEEAAWPQEMGRVSTFEPGRFLDRVMLVCVNPYSGVSAAELGLDLDEAAWVERSMALRVEHEFTHYATKRLCGQMRLNLLDEAIADCLGTTYALGRFRGEWLLRFLGLERWPALRADGRAHAYRGELSDRGFALLCALMVPAAAGLERVAARYCTADQRGRFLCALMRLTLEELAAPEAEERFAAAWAEAGGGGAGATG